MQVIGAVLDSGQGISVQGLTILLQSLKKWSKARAGTRIQVQEIEILLQVHAYSRPLTVGRLQSSSQSLLPC